MSSSEHDVLDAAARTALTAPSIYNTQPWRWRVDANTLELRGDPDRGLPVADPDGRLLRLSCGIALHHARMALAAAGWRATVHRLPDPGDPELLARIRLLEHTQPDEAARAMVQAAAIRRTDRRPYGPDLVSDADIVGLIAAAAREGVGLHDVRIDQMPMLAVAVASAEASETGDADYRGELMRWTNRPPWSNDGVPQSTGVTHTARRIPVRDFVFPPNEGLPVEAGGDAGSRYLVVYGPGDEPLDWLRAGEAASAVLLTAVILGLAVAPISDVIEVAHPRSLVRGMLPSGWPYLVIRCGHAVDASPVPAVPRRDATDVVQGPRP